MANSIDTGNIRTKKALIRKEKLEVRHALSAEECSKMSSIICERLLASDEYKNAGSILLYKAYNNEVDTDMIFERAVADGKTVAYPVCRMAEGEPDLSFYVVNDNSQLTEGYMGIMEPDASLQLELFDNRADICITPGVAFDGKCHRIGYGKAFYDRYIRLNEPACLIGLAYEIQMADDFETEERDMAVDMVITDKTVYKR